MKRTIKIISLLAALTVGGCVTRTVVIRDISPETRAEILRQLEEIRAAVRP